MSSINIAALVNLLGFTTGAALYAMLLVMVFNHPGSHLPEPSRGKLFGWTTNRLILATAVLGLLWNVGALSTYAVRELGIDGPLPLIMSISYSALGFLPAVVVHSALRTRDSTVNRRGARWIVVVAYCLSAMAGLLHFYDALTRGGVPSLWGLRGLTFGYLILIAALFLAARHDEGWKRAVGASALAVFAVSALHLSRHHDFAATSWLAELTGHHASLPLVLAILYQDYRFALADIFLKRALALLLLVALALGLYLGVVSPLMSEVQRQSPGPRIISVLLGLWVVTALLYPFLRSVVSQFVDKIILRRTDYVELRGDVVRLLGSYESAEEILSEVCRVLRPTLSASEVTWRIINPDKQRTDDESRDGANVDQKSVPQILGNYTPEFASEVAVSGSRATLRETVVVLDRTAGASAFAFVPTAEPPFYAFIIGALAGGRRLLSDDLAMIETVVTMVARRIDTLRVTHERCEQSLREQEISKLATEAQLRALRAQVNPHFLFNALTTIGYLVQTAPDRALETLMKLSSLLRGVLRTAEDFVTLGDELKLIASYLDIERVRFEERLRVRMDVPEALRSIRLPCLLVQPLIENAIKHGIAPARLGGEVAISACLEPPPHNEERNGKPQVLCITVSDTGVGASEIEIARGRRRGVGLSNVEERLRCYCGEAASLRVASTPGAGTIACLRLPIADAQPSQIEMQPPARLLKQGSGA